MLNNNGENALSRKRCSALSTPIITVTGPTNAKYGSISRASATALSSVPATKPGARKLITCGISRPSITAMTIRIRLIVPMTRPAKAAAATGPPLSRARR